MKPYSPEQIFSPQSPLIVGTAAERMVPNLTRAVTETTTLALRAESDLAAAYSFRGWAEYLSAPNGEAAIADIRKAAQLDPREALFSQSAAYLTRKG